jgi:2-oxo-4-hydroxy-4-carboxy--5-ureidoimidazoline (OHCU) decarboxylase
MWDDEDPSIHWTQKQRKAVEEKMLKDREEQLAKKFNLPSISINKMGTIRENIMEKMMERLEKEFNPPPIPINKIVDLRKIIMY